MWSRRIISVSSSPPWRVGLVASFNVTSRLDSSGPDRLRADGHVVRPRPPQTDDEWRLALTPNSLFSAVCFVGQIIVLHGNQRFSQIVSFDDAQGKSKSCSLFTSSPLGLYVIDCLRLVRHPSFIIKSTISHFPCSPDELALYFNAMFKRNH